METAIVTLVCIALVVVGGMSMAQGFLASADSIALGKEELGSRGGEIRRTGLTALNVYNSPSRLERVEITVKNSGQTKLYNFAQWDVIIQYYDTNNVYRVVYLPYTSGVLGNNQWRVKGLYLNAEAGTPEAFEPGLLNFGEELVVQAQLNPAVKNKANDNLAVVSTQNGISASRVFVGGKINN